MTFLPWSPLGGTGAGSKEVVIAWELALGDHVIPIPGASRPASNTDSARAVHLQLTDDELSRIEGQFS